MRPNNIEEELDIPLDNEEIDPIEYNDMSTKPLSNFTIEDICTMLRDIDGIMNARVDTYCDAIQAQNISGTVLAKCSLDELKSVLNMNFGDWELFHMVIMKMRKTEKGLLMRQRAQSREPSNRIRENIDILNRSIEIELSLIHI